MYKIIGADGKEYGPVSAEQIRQWLGEHRLNAQSKVRAEGGAEWKVLAEVPEFAEALKSRVPPVALTASAPAPKTSGMAIASLVLGICGLVSCGITSLVGLVLGIVALSKINKSHGQQSGNGLAIAGIVVSAVFLLMIWVAMFLPALAQAKVTAQRISCVNNMKQLGTVLALYADDNNHRYPSATNWCDAILKYAGTTNVFKCPAGSSDARCHYAFNARLSGLEIGLYPNTVVLFECDGGWNVSGGPELALTKPRHGRISVVALGDGSIQQMSESRFGQLRWEP